MKKYIKFKTLIFGSLLLLSVIACQEDKDVAPIGGTDAYPTVSVTLSGGGSTTFTEFSEPVFVFDVSIDKLFDRSIDISVEQVGGTATLHEDYDVVNATIAPYTKTAQIMVMIHNDTEVEGTETLELQLVSGPSLASKFLINPNSVLPSLDLTIEDWVFCNWTLDARDTYGDGWNGGVVVVEYDGTSTEYYAHGPQDVYEIPVTDGSDFSFSYVSGGGGFCGSPGWECENQFILTAPDGTVYEGGSDNYSAVIAEGVIVDGTNSCN